MSSSYWSSRSATQRKNAQTSSNPSSSGPVIHPDIDPSPKPRPIYQFLAIGFIIFLGFLQLFPATHIRHPLDPFRKWIPVTSTPSSSSSSSKESFTTTHDGEDGLVHVVSWMDCLDLRVLSVLANSTLSGSRYPELVHFHFFIPEGHENKVPYYKLKVLFPHSNLEILGQNEVVEKIRKMNSSGQYTRVNFEELAPFVIPSVHLSLGKFIYVSPNVIIKGRVEELIGADLSNYAIAVTEDCSKRLDAYAKPDVLSAIQRSASKPWVSQTPYPQQACIPDLSVLVIDARKLENDVVESILWWTKVMNPVSSERGSSPTNPAMTLALHGKYLKLSTSWLVRNSTSEEITDEIMVINYDGPKSVCSETSSVSIPQSDHGGNLWRKFLPPMSDQILGS